MYTPRYPEIQVSDQVGGKKSKVLLRDCRNTAARRRRSFLRLPRRAFIGGLRYGEGRLYTKNAGDALR